MLGKLRGHGARLSDQKLTGPARCQQSPCTELDCATGRHLHVHPEYPRELLLFPANFTRDKCRPRKVSHRSRATGCGLCAARAELRPGPALLLSPPAGQGQRLGAGAVPWFTPRGCCRTARWAVHANFRRHLNINSRVLKFNQVEPECKEMKA